MHYVMSDLHGRWDLYTAMLEQIEFSPEDRLYILGDVVDRNRGGIRIFKDILARPNVQMLLGNNEHMMRHAVTAPEERTLNGRETNRAIWYRNGGNITQAEWDLEPETVRARILERIESLPLNLTVEVGSTRFLLCHASPVSMFRVYGFFYPDEKEFAVWQRIPLAPPPLGDRTILIGHTPTRHVQRADWPRMRIAHGDGVIDLDCGCVFPEYGGQLGCLRLEDGMEFYSVEGSVRAGEAAAWKARYVQSI